MANFTSVLKTATIDSPLQSVLIVDSDRDQRSVIKDSLVPLMQGNRIEFDEADTSDTAIDLAMNHDYDCIYLDNGLADMDAIRLMKKLESMGWKSRACPVIIMTDEEIDEKKFRLALVMGVQDILPKSRATANCIRLAYIRAKEVFTLNKTRQKAEKELNQTRKMEAVGQLTSGIAHDFNNLLTVIVGNTHLLRRRLENLLDETEYTGIGPRLAAIETVTSKGTEMIRRLMVFTRQGDLALEKWDINAVLSGLIDLIKTTVGERIHVKITLPDKPFMAMMDENVFTSIILNLASNARDAMPEGGCLSIETDTVFLDDAYTKTYPDVTTGTYAVIAVSDTGIGMEPEVVKHAFEPFFTTKPTGEGTGLGLSMAYGFAQQCGGHIHLYSEIGKGTVFKFYIPLLDENSSAACTQTANKLMGEGEYILVVEDDENMRILARAMLERLNYRVIEAPDADTALDILETEHTKIGMLLTDIHMYGSMDGIGLAKIVKERFGHIAILLASSFTETTLHHYQPVEGFETIGKPYKKEALASKIFSVKERQGKQNADHFIDRR